MNIEISFWIIFASITVLIIWSIIDRIRNGGGHYVDRPDIDVSDG